MEILKFIIDAIVTYGTPIAIFYLGRDYQAMLDDREKKEKKHE